MLAMESLFMLNFHLINKVYKLFIFVLLFRVLIFNPLNAQVHNFTFEQISLNEGLSQSIVTFIHQDSIGFMWFGTEDGLNKYDGYKFTVFRNDPKDPTSISYNQINAIAEDRHGTMWFGCFYGGLNRYDYSRNRFTRFQNDPNDSTSLSHNNITCIYEDHSGTLWIGTEGGLNKMVVDSLDTTRIKFIRYLNDPKKPSSLSQNNVQSIIEDAYHVLWIGTRGGLNRLNMEEREKPDPIFIHHLNQPGDPLSLSHNYVRTLYGDRNGVLYVGTVGGGLNIMIPSGRGVDTPGFIHHRHDPKNPKSLSHDEVYSIFEDTAGLLWIGTNGGGIDIFDRENEQFHNYRNNPYQANSLCYNEIRAISEDRSGLIWIGTYGGGIDKVDKTRNQFAHYAPILGNPNSLSHEIVWSIYEDSAGILWLGTHGGGLNRFDRKSNQWKLYLHHPNDPNSLSHNIVRLIYPDRAGFLWIGTNGGGICRFDPTTEKFTTYQNDPLNSKSLSYNEIRSLFQDSQGYLWIGTNGGGLNKMIPGASASDPPEFIHYQNRPNDPTSISNNFVREMLEDAAGNLWFGTQGGGLNKFDPKTGIATHYRANPADSNALNNDYIFTVYADSAGILWLGTWGGGLNRFDPKTGKFKTYLTEDGLPNNEIYGILEDNRGYLWLSTNNGLSRFNPRTETFRNYNIADGLQSNEFNGGSYFKSRSGELFFGGINGFNSFYPDHIEDNTCIPPVVITNFQKFNQDFVFGKSLTELDKITLSYRDYFISFEFAALDFTTPSKNQYAFKMEGLDKDWIYTNAQKRFATYTTLAPGTYTFRVKGSNNDGFWNETGYTLKVIITPPIWKTWWFRILAGFFVLLMIYSWYTRRLKTMQMKFELKTAHDAQMSIMPQTDPEIPGFDISGICLPANEVGGDFFDYIWMDQEKTRLLIVIGDVSGKAMKSAMIAIMTSGMLYSKTDDTHSIEEIMAHLNRLMYHKTEKQMFTALCLALLDIKTREITISNAGLNEPFLKTRLGVKIIQSIGAKYPLGSVEQVTYTSQKIELASGDVLILFTDGVPEAFNHSKNMYGEDRLHNLIQDMNTATLSACEIKEKIIKDVKRFAGLTQQHDDMAVVVVKTL
jgi:ligand-binding sensor domain-containing protein